jgi:hypothetical protein
MAPVVASDSLVRLLCQCAPLYLARAHARAIANFSIARMQCPSIYSFFGFRLSVWLNRRRRGNTFRNYNRKLQEFLRARQRLTQAAAPSDDCELARTLLPWPPSESEPELLQPSSLQPSSLQRFCWRRCGEEIARM